MSFFRKSLIAITAVAATALVLNSPAEARHRHHVMMHAAPAGPVLVPAHEKPGFPHAVGPSPIDLGLGPVFPFGGWPATL